MAGSDLLFPVAAADRERAGGVEAGGRARVGGHVAKDEASVYEGGLTRRCLEVKQKGWTVEEERA